MNDPRSARLDANESAFFTRQVEYIKSKIYETAFAKMAAKQYLPVSSEAGAGAETITFRTFTAFGIAEFIAGYADDLPRADVSGEEDTRPVRDIGAAYGYNVKEIRKAMATGTPLQQRKANAARMAIEQKINKTAWFGSESHGLYGLINQPNVTKSAATTGTWSGETADNIMGDIFDCLDDIITLTHGVERPNRLLLPLSQNGLIRRKRIGTDTSTTIYEFLRTNRPEVEIGWVPELTDVTPNPRTGSGSADCMAAYDYNIDKISLELPNPLEQMPAEQRNLEYVVNMIASTGGVIAYFPLSVHIVDGI